MDHPGRATGRKFALRIGIRAGLFVFVMFGIPLALYALDQVWGEDDVTVREAIRVTTATEAGMIIYLSFLISLISPCWRRLKELGLPGFGSLLVVFLMLADLPFFMAGRSEASFGASFSTVDGPVPFYLLAALVLVAGMAALRSPIAGQGVDSRFGFAGRAVVLLSVLMSLDVVFKIALANWMSVETDNLGQEDAPSEIFLFVIRHAIWAWSLSPLVFVALTGATAWCVARSRRASLSSGN
jgi:uncharacterized membrane protein YhaH (DUF805 family)